MANGGTWLDGHRFSSSAFSSLEHLKKLYPNLNFVDAKKLNTINESDLTEWKD